MLILTRKEGEAVLIGDDIRVTVTRIDNHHVKLGIDAPPDVQVAREELLGRPVTPRRTPQSEPSE